MRDRPTAIPVVNAKARAETELKRERQRLFRRFDDMSERVEAYRIKAAECERAAAAATDANVKAIYGTIARQWRDVAEQAEVLERMVRRE
ncbi:MAG: hypothetical protein WAK55_21670 [Xanthobacteraceae bacterium]